MNDIQVGDYVIAVKQSVGGFYARGAIGKVVRLLPDLGVLDVCFTAGRWDKDSVDQAGIMAVPTCNFKKHTLYAATFTDPAAVAAVAKGHVPGSGLQRHSVGPIYPLVVVTWATGDEPYKFTVENLATGEQATVGGELLRFTDYATAYAMAEMLASAQAVTITWTKR